MTGLGTLVNMAAILIGSGIGLLLKNGIPKRLQTTISSAVGLCVVFVGVTGAIISVISFDVTESDIGPVDIFLCHWKFLHSAV